MSTMTSEAPPIPSLGASGAPGRVHIRERVIEKVVREASAVTIGAPRRDVNVDVAEWNGGLTVRVAARLPIPALEDTEAILAEEPVIERIRRVQRALAGELARLTGREIRRVSFTVTGAIIPERKRVR